MKEAIVILTLMGCDHSENNCDYIQTASQTYSSEIACMRASEDQILGVAEIEYPIILANCDLQTVAVAEFEVNHVLENELHEPDLAADQIVVSQKPTRPINSAFSTIRNVGGAAAHSVWRAAVNSTSAINPF